MYLGTNAAIRGCQEYFNRCAAAGSPIGSTQTPTAYDNAASFNGTNQFLSVASNSTLTVTGTSFTYAFWANAVNTTLTQLVISKTNAVSDQREYQILFISGGLRFNVFPDGVFANRSEINIAAGPVNSWNFYVCRYDSAAGTIAISINGGTFSSVGSVPAITQTFSNTLQIANSAAGITGSLYTGQLSSVGFWKKALSASEVTQLWNNGAGRTYASLDSGLRTNLISWWALNQNSVTADSHGTNNLTNNGTVTAPNIGPVVTSLADPRQLIIDFAQGIDRLGLWNSMVCWPLRSSQNAASGSTAFSLGGLGRFDGTLVNGPTRGANGMTFTAASSQYITIPLPLPTNTLGMASVFARGALTGGTNVALAWDIATSRQIAILDANNAVCGTQAFTSSGTNAIIGDAVGTTGLWGAAVSSYELNTGLRQVLWRNSSLGSSPTTATSSTFASSPIVSGGTSTFGIGARGGTGGNPYNGQIAFSLASNVVLTGLESAIYALYRQTLGLGLGLP